MKTIEIGLVIPKPIEKEDEEFFQEAMAFCCDDSNNAMMFEYSDRYVIQEKPEPEVHTPVEYMSMEDRMHDLEDALIELANLVG